MVRSIHIDEFGIRIFNYCCTLNLNRAIVAFLLTYCIYIQNKYYKIHFFKKYGHHYVMFYETKLKVRVNAKRFIFNPKWWTLPPQNLFLILLQSLVHYVNKNMLLKNRFYQEIWRITLRRLWNYFQMLIIKESSYLPQQDPKHCCLQKPSCHDHAQCSKLSKHTLIFSQYLGSGYWYFILLSSL